ncbi:MAG: GntR family transcriptional regulator [Parvibaculaceae bacterium]
MARKRVTHHALHKQALNELREMIVRGDLKAGEKIAEASVCEMLGISRTPLREALKLLSAEGLIELRPNRGAAIAPLRVEELTSLFEVVAGIERLAAELAALRLTPDDIGRLRALQEEMERYFGHGDRKDYFRLNQEVHGLIVSGAKNEVLSATHAWLFARAERARYLALDVRGRWLESVDEHRAILEALEARDAEKAGRLLETHIKHTGTAVLAALARKESDGP